MPRLPDAFQIGPFPIAAFQLALILGGVVWYLLIPRSAAHFNLPRDLVESVVYRLMVGGLVGAKLTEILRSPASFWSSPLLLASIPTGVLPLAGAILGAVFWALLLLRGRWNSVPSLLDAMAGPLAAGVAAASLGGGAEWSMPLFFGFLAVAVLLAKLRPQAEFRGHIALAGVILGSVVLLFADLFRAGPTVTAGVSWFQLQVSAMGLSAYIVARWLAQ